MANRENSPRQEHINEWFYTVFAQMVETSAPVANMTCAEALGALQHTIQTIEEKSILKLPTAL